MSSNFEAIMIRKVSKEPKNSYLRVLDNGFKTKFGGSIINGNGDEESGRATFGFQLSVLKKGIEFNNALTCSIYFSISKL